MRRLLLIVALVGSLPGEAAEPQAFEPVPFRLDLQSVGPSAEGGSLRFGSELLFSKPFTIGSGVSRGPIRVDYGIPSGLKTPWAPRLLDAPGSGYRKQRAKAVPEKPTA